MERFRRRRLSEGGLHPNNGRYRAGGSQPLSPGYSSSSSHSSAGGSSPSGQRLPSSPLSFRSGSSACGRATDGIRRPQEGRKRSRPWVDALSTPGKGAPCRGAFDGARAGEEEGGGLLLRGAGAAGDAPTTGLASSACGSANEDTNNSSSSGGCSSGGVICRPMRNGGRTDGPPIGDNGAQGGPPKGSELDGGSFALWGDAGGVDEMSPAGGSPVDWATRGSETGNGAPCPGTTRGGEASRLLLGTNGGMSTPTRATETDSGPMSYTDGYFRPIRRHREADGGPVESNEVDDRPVKVGVDSSAPIRCVGGKYAPMGAILSCNLRMGGDHRVPTGPIIHEPGDDGKSRKSDRDTRALRDDADDDEGTAAHGKQHLTVRVVVHEVLSEDFGLFTWPSGVVLACLVWARRREFRGASVVEIGAGTALPGLLAAKLGARVVLTDREDAPWVLDNMRSAVAANGLLPSEAAPSSAAPAAEQHRADNGGGCNGSGGGGGSPAAARGEELEERQQALSHHGEPRNSQRDREGEEDEGGASGLSLADTAASVFDAAAGVRPTGGGNTTVREGGGGREEWSGDGAGRCRAPVAGSCSVRGLSWGRVEPATIRLATELWRPEIVLGADVFYSSEQFDGVLATVYMLLSASAAPAPVSSGMDVNTAPPKEEEEEAAAAAAVSSLAGGKATVVAAVATVDTAAPAAAARDSSVAPAAAVAPGAAVSADSGSGRTIAGSDAPVGSRAPGTDSGTPADVAGKTTATTTIAGNSSSARSSRKGVFLTAYQERSARRSLRPLLRKWGMSARVLRDAPRQVLPSALWESGRYDSVGLLEITLLQKK